MTNICNEIEKSVFENILDLLPLGIILIDENHEIQFLNKWLGNQLKISTKQILGKSLGSLNEQGLSPRFNWALEQVLRYDHPQHIYAILNQFMLPISIQNGPYGHIDKMQQDVQILPLTYQHKRMALIIIKDVSVKMHLKNTLMTVAARFEKSSFVDMLTGAYNRRFLFKYLEAELSNAKREKYNIICCLYDIDHFKKVNDELGHDAGDEVLVFFTQLVKSVLRPTDFFFRYGGEEFISISSRVPLEEAPLIPNRIREKLESSSIPVMRDKEVTCSGGVSYWTPSQAPISAEQLVSLADIQLYKAKTSGRNRIMMNDQKR